MGWAWWGEGEGGADRGIGGVGRGLDKLLRILVRGVDACVDGSKMFGLDI